MSTTAQQSLIPVSEDWGEPTPITPSDAWSQFGPLSPPPGWSLDSVTTVPFRIGFAADNHLASSGVTNDSANAPIPVVAETQVSVARMVFSRGSEELELEVVPKRDPLAAIWSDAILSRGSKRRIGIGLGYSSGETTVLDAGDRLFRGTYGDTSADALATAGSQTWRDRAAARALQFVNQIR